MSPEHPLARSTLGALVVALSAAFLVAGCSDDVVCPGTAPPDIEPFISARIVEVALERGDSTWVEVRAAADSLPTLLFVSVNDRQIDDVAVEEFALVVSLEEDAILWHPGTPCSLRVTTNYGFATSSEPVSSGVVVTAPDTIFVGQPLAVSWTAADDADYYVVSGTLDGYEIVATVRETAVTIEAADIPAAGLVRGRVDAVAGPFPEVGSGGNISGAGWGVLTVAYHDQASVFEVTVVDTGGS